ncbi:TssN family type VI secretion system protein [Pedobacter cryoconitis]|uniref:Positive regulator of sigma E activity n=1 Tax=Pedobacter cryoconitis TaxID=188932 RepID=A0A7X0IZS4_9SPHI|nr:TssN family type VI secretion system protein [Pedobacter cryoconitis]MBB6498426.1 positive regulator of sigma E activity [Pedobacter cryoconitis]
MDVKSFFLRYLLFPLIFIVSAALLSIVNKKNQFLNNKRLIIGILLLSIILALPGFLGFLSFDFMPWGYLICQIYYIITGSLFVFLFTSKYPKELLERKLFIIFGILVGSLLGFYLFQFAFNWLSDIHFGIWAATSIPTFIVPLLFWWAYVALISIPTEIYKIWEYPSSAINIDMDHLDFDRMLVLELELYKNTDDPEPLRVKVKAPENMVFGNWFYKFIEDYNLKFPKSPVRYNSEYHESYKWIFFIKTSFFKKNVFIDPDQDIIQNRITEKVTIYAKRVSENAIRPETIGDESIFI